jgi:hypothetical protein
MLTSKQEDALESVEDAITDVIARGRKLSNDMNRAAMINQYQSDLIKDLVSVIIDHKDVELIRSAKQMYRKYKNKMRCFHVKQRA